MDWADDVTYAVHDMQDFHIVGPVPLDQLAGDSGERKRFCDSFFDDSGALRGKFQAEGLSKPDIESSFEHLFETVLSFVPPFDGSTEARASLHYVSSMLISRYVDALNPRAKPARHESLVTRERSARAEVAILKELAWFYIINRPSLATVQHGQEQVIEELHKIYLKAAGDSSLHKLFPAAQREVLRVAGHDRRCVTDLVAGLTEEMGFELYWRLTGVKKASILDAAALSAR